MLMSMRINLRLTCIPLTNHLVAEQILPCFDTARDREGHFPLICDHTVDAPFLAAVQAIFPDLHGRAEA